jgi:hypothetical protein
MKLITPVALPQLDGQLHANDKTIFLGSCFAENIGHRYPTTQAEVVVNPLGITFNPYSLLQQLKGCIHPDMYFTKDEKVVHFQYHGSLSAQTKEGLGDILKNQHLRLLESIKGAKTIFLSFGSAWHYVLKQVDDVVCNNHKGKADLFEKRIFSSDQMREIMTEICSVLQSINPNIRMVFTVSPVKYIKDGIIESSRSKALLLSAVHELCESHQKAMYFPSYEIVNDELRDYRFYANDMAHPSELAQEIIFEKVQDCFFSDELKEKTKGFQKLKRLKRHSTENLNENQLNEWNTKLKTEEKRFTDKWK